MAWSFGSQVLLDCAKGGVGANQVGLDQVIESIVGTWTVGTPHASIRDDSSERSLPLRCGIDRGRDVISIPDVGGQDLRRASHRIDLRGGLFQAGHGSTYERDLGSLCGQSKRGGSANARAGAGDEKVLVLLTRELCRHEVLLGGESLSQIL